MDIRIPNLGEGAESGAIVNIYVKVGDRIAKDQTIVELENEKAVAPIPSPAAGMVQKVLVKVGDKVSVGQAIISLAEEGQTEPAVTQRTQPKEAAPAVNAPTPKSLNQNASAGSSSAAGLPLPASPSIRKMAADLGIDLNKVRGSQAGGRIVLADLRAYVEHLQQAALEPRASAPAHEAARAAHVEPIDFSKWGPVTRKPLSSLRQKIGQKMTDSWTSIPHVTQFDEADITELMALRKMSSASYEKKGAKLTITPFVMKAVTAALKKFPQFNSSLDEAAGALILKEYIHLGIAVDTEAGLIVPVLRDADKKTMLELARELESLGEKTRQRKVSLDELKGSSFTISNLGSIGGTFFTPIVNKPEVAILGVGRGVLKPVVVSGKKKDAAKKIEPRLMLPLGLSYDHRVIDGADGARFIRAIVENLETFNAKDAKL